MHVISRKRLREFAETHPDAAQSLDDWYRLMRRARFTNANELVAAFPYVSLLPDDVVVFNIGGNKYRLSVRMRYRRQCVYIRKVQTHRDYTRYGP